MKDSFGRDITYMRISVTDVCNLRCRYCMPDVREFESVGIMSANEILTVIEAASTLGVRKIRFTGGEPLMRKDIAEICRRTSRVPEINEVCLTTNGILLPGLAHELRDSGVRRVNISLDTLKPERYSYITRGGSLSDVLRGIDAAMNAGLRVKLNTVLIAGFNDDEISDLAGLTLGRDIDIRFIELMPMLEDFSAGKFLSSQKIFETLTDIESLGTDGVAKMFRLKGAKGNIGFISPVSKSFCQNCNRIRLTADGFIKPCLHSDTEIFIRHKSRDDLIALIAEAIRAKPGSHALNQNHHTQSLRTMNRIGG